MAAWVRGEEKASETQQKKRETNVVDKFGCTWDGRSKLETF